MAIHTSPLADQTLRPHPATPARRHRRLSCILSATCLMTLAVVSGGARLAPHAQAAAAYYHITDLGTLGGDYSYATGLNNAGVPVGYAGNTIPDPYFPTQSRAVYWIGSTAKDLGTFNGVPDAYAQEINDAGQIIGGGFITTTIDPAFGFPYSRAYFWSAGHLTILPSLGGGISAGNGLAQNGTAVGASYLTGDTVVHATLWAHGQVHDLGTLPEGTNSTAIGIDGAGQVIVGVADITTTVDPVTGFPDQHAALWQGGTIHDLGSLGGNSAAFTTNGSSVVGDSYLQDNTTFHPTLWAGGHLTDLGVLSGDINGQATGINSDGLIVGNSGSATEALHALLWHGSTLLDLNRLIPAASGWQLTAAYSINDRGQIAGWGTIDGQTHGFVLTPTRNAAAGPTSADLGPVPASALPGVGQPAHRGPCSCGECRGGGERLVILGGAAGCRTSACTRHHDADTSAPLRSWRVSERRGVADTAERGTITVHGPVYIERRVSWRSGPFVCAGV